MPRTMDFLYGCHTQADKISSSSSQNQNAMNSKSISNDIKEEQAEVNETRLSEGDGLYQDCLGYPNWVLAYLATTQAMRDGSNLTSPRQMSIPHDLTWCIQLPEGLASFELGQGDFRSSRFQTFTARNEPSQLLQAPSVDPEFPMFTQIDGVSLLKLSSNEPILEHSDIVPVTQSLASLEATFTGMYDPMITPTISKDSCSQPAEIKCLQQIATGSSSITSATNNLNLVHVHRYSNCQRGRKARTVFTQRQLRGLENYFKEKKYLSTPDRYELADSLNLDEAQVKTWLV